MVVLELGANDALRGLPIGQTEAHLSAMVRMAQAAGARVLLVGMQVPPNYGPAYTRQFAQVFQAVSRQQKTGLVPFLLAGAAFALSLRAALTGAGWPLVALPLMGAFGAHLWDIAARWRR